MTLSKGHRIGLAAGLLVTSLVGALAFCEWQGWPMLRRPAENWIGQRLDRTVSFDGTGQRWKLHLLGSPRLEVERLELGGPSWSTLGPTLVAGNARLEMRWRDLLALRHGQPLAIKSLEAETLALRVQRLTDGRASWHFGSRSGSKTSDGGRPGFNGVRMEQLIVQKGTAVVDDRAQALSLVARFALREGQAADNSGIQAEAEGRYRSLPLHATLKSGSALPWLSADPKAPAVPVDFKVQAGRSKLDFKGQVGDLLASQGLTGRYTVSGPSLAAVGEPLGLTLPTTPAFAMQGQLTREGERWSSAVEEASIGRSRLSGDFVYLKPAEGKPTLTGALRGSIVWLADLGPAIGTDEGTAQTSRRVLPDRNFDLPSLSAMNADVRIKIDRLESGNERLQAVKPLQTRLLLKDGVLLLDELDARLAKGRISGRVRLDGREPVAQWDTQLLARGLLLEQWVAMKEPYVTGRLGARLDLKGRGKSTAELLGSVDGRAQVFWTRGTLSHRLVELAGIDLAQTVGVMIQGDKALPVTCGVADMNVRQGVARPQLFVIDTADSTLRLDGALSLNTERLALVMDVAPKDMSPLTLRTPVHIAGTFSAPQVSLDKSGLIRRIAPALALAALNPIAGLLPLVDLGEKDDGETLRQCEAALARARNAV